LFISLTFVAFVGVFFLFSLGGCGKHGGSHETAKLRTCRLPGIKEELLCGKLTVFENRQSRAGRTIDLNVVVLPALDPNKKEEPLFDLAGGPGAASTEGAPFYAREGKEYRRHRDVVLVDQRQPRDLASADSRQCRESRVPVGGHEILLNSQAHFGYMAGAAQILRKTGC
jgi:hypothetical protein